MKRPVLGTLLFAAVACLVMLSCSQPLQQAVNGQPAAKGQQWQYRLVQIPEKAGGGVDFKKTQELLNNLGADGWEYAGGFEIHDKVSLFKRPKR